MMRTAAVEIISGNCFLRRRRFLGGCGGGRSSSGVVESSKVSSEFSEDGLLGVSEGVCGGGSVVGLGFGCGGSMVVGGGVEVG